MKRFAANVVLASSALLMTVRADLTIFHDTTAYDTVRRFLNDPLASCDQVNRTTRYLYADDISGDHFGLEGEKVMVVGAAKEVAANTRFGHFTVCRNRNFDVYDSKGRKREHCTRDGQFHCSCQSPKPWGPYHGVSILACLTNSIGRRLP